MFDWPLSAQTITGGTVDMSRGSDVEWKRSLGGRELNLIQIRVFTLGIAPAMQLTLFIHGYFFALQYSASLQQRPAA